jgi:tetratricopeptide (TPR) repeat protein
MEIALASARRRITLLIVSLVTAAALIFQVGLIWTANDRLESNDLASIERGAALVPDNGDAWDRLGRFRQWDFVNSDLPGAIADYQRAVGVDRRSAHYWMDLAGAYEAAGDQVRAQQAYSRAETVYPASAEVAFYYGNFLLREGKYPQAYQELQRAVRGDPTLLSLAISRSWRASGDVNQILKQLLPPNTDAYLQAVDFFAHIRESDPALVVWQRLVDLGQSFPLDRAFPLLDELIQEDRAGDARRVWRESLMAAALPYAEPAFHSLIWNGNFSTNFKNGGLDWRWKELSGVTIGFDPEPAPHGSRSVRLDFSGGTNLAVDGPFQYVPVEPSRSYHFRGFMRTDQITTESGTRFAIGDPNHADAPTVITENFTGSHPWTALEADVPTGPQTHFLVVRVFRPPSRLFENRIDGTVWIADLLLVPQDRDAERRSQ